MSGRRCAMVMLVLLAVTGCARAPASPNTPVPAASAGPEATATFAVPRQAQASESPLPVATIEETATLSNTLTPPPIISESDITLTLSPTAQPAPTATLTATATAGPVPTASPVPEARLATGRELQIVGDCAAARQQFAAVLAVDAAALGPEVAAEARYRLAQCYLEDDAPIEASSVLGELLATTTVSDTYHAPATFLLGEAYSALAVWDAAEDNYMAYLEMAPELASLTWQRIGAVRQSAGNLPGAVEAYNNALPGSPDWNNSVATRQALATLAVLQNDGNAAVAQYDVLRNNLTEGSWAAQMQWLAGSALEQTGNQAGAIERWQAAAAAAPSSSYAYQAMIALVNADAAVDEYLRGLVDYYNGAYQLAIDAFNRYESQDPTGKQGNSWYYTALSHSALREYDAAVAGLGNLIAAYPDSPLWADAWLAKARAQARAGNTAGAIATYRQLAETRPDAPQAPQALWAAANLEAGTGATAAAAQAYLALARRYPAADEAWQSYQAAGLSYFRLKDWLHAAESWEEMVNADMPAATRPVAYYWLGRAQAAAGEPDAAQQSWQSALQWGPTNFYGLRAADWAAEINRPIQTASPLTGTNASPAELTAEMENWLRGWAGEGTLALPATVTTDPDWQRGQTLLTLGLRGPALENWSRVQEKAKDTPWTLAALATAYSDAGAYRLSILCAEELAALSPGGDLTAAPLALQRLAYPMAFAELVQEQATRWGLDPRLIAAVIRQESRFESEAISYAAAQGLMQVIPDTADWIAQQLGWPGFQPEQIYRPYVNITFGTYYLQWALQSFDGSVATALAAYNAGPGNAATWRTKAPGDDDLLVAMIDLSETRLYVQVVWAQYNMYERIYP